MTLINFSHSQTAYNKVIVFGIKPLARDRKRDLTNMVSTHGIIIKTGTMTDGFTDGHGRLPLGTAPLTLETLR